MNFLAKLNRQAYYWLFIVLVGVAMEASALYFQYVVGDEPCVLCVHVRIWVAAFILVGLFGLALRKSHRLRQISNLLSVAAAIGFLERSWETLATERGWSESSCAMNAGLPAWFDLERWLPAIFEVRDACGFTPYVFAKVSMAEILVGVGIAALIVTVLMTLSSIQSNKID